jgi:hypothetical protein
VQGTLWCVRFDRAKSHEISEMNAKIKTLGLHLAGFVTEFGLVNKRCQILVGAAKAVPSEQTRPA